MRRKNNLRSRLAIVWMCLLGLAIMAISTHLFITPIDFWANNNSNAGCEYSCTYECECDDKDDCGYVCKCKCECDEDEED